MWTRQSQKRFQLARIRFPTTVKDLSDDNRSVHRLTQNERIGIHMHVVPLDDLSHCCRLGRSTRLWTDLILPEEDCWWSSLYRSPI